MYIQITFVWNASSTGMVWISKTLFAIKKGLQAAEIVNTVGSRLTESGSTRLRLGRENNRENIFFYFNQKHAILCQYSCIRPIPQQPRNLCEIERQYAIVKWTKSGNHFCYFLLPFRQVTRMQDSFPSLSALLCFHY